MMQAAQRIAEDWWIMCSKKRKVCDDEGKVPYL